MTTTQSVQCDVCRRMIGSAPGLVSHMKAMHPNEWRIQQEATLSRALPFRGARPVVPPPPAPAPNGVTVRWEDPPARGRAARVVEELTPIVRELRRNPGTWARIREFGAKGSASSSRKPIAAAFPDLELRASATASGSAIWARFVEPED